MKKYIAGIEEENKKFLLVSGVILLFFAILAYLFPYTGDDWAWGSSIGTERLETFFDNYNGRYLGNLLVMALTRSKLLNIIVMAFSYYFSCFLCYRYTKKRSNVSLLLAAVLFFMMPRDMFAQSVVWTAGYTNYVPSAIVSVAYICMIRNITGKKEPSYSKYMPVVAFVMALCGALFMENITLFHICLGVAAVGYTYLRFKKFYAMHISFLAGSILGAIVMFTNSAYGSIASGEDEYRDTPNGLGEIIRTCIHHAQVICENLILSNPFMCLVATVLIMILVVYCLGRVRNSKKKSLIFGILAVHVITFAIILWRATGILNFLYNDKISMLLTLLYVGSLFLLVLICVERYRRFRILLPIYCVPVVVAPLLVVNPIGPRCFYAPYLMMMVFIVALFDYLLEKIRVKKRVHRLMGYGLGIVFAIQMFINIGIFYPIHHYDSLRNEYAKVQSDDGEKKIIICNLPNEAYLWVATPEIELWSERYKLFYGLAEDAELEIIDYTEYEAFVEQYSKQ